MKETYHSKRAYCKLARFAVKYMPTLMALSCSAKLWLLNQSEHTHTIQLTIVNLINAVVFILVAIGAYLLGMHFGLCWKHRSLCRTCVYGCVGYVCLIMFDVTKEDSEWLCTGYAIIVILMTIIYRATTCERREKCRG